jgi:hypothetical protein
MTDWIEWNGGECPIKSDMTRVEYKMRHNGSNTYLGTKVRWVHESKPYDIIAYRIIEDHEPMTYPKEIEASTLTFELMRSIVNPQTREQITAQIEALQKQLDAMPVVMRMHWDGQYFTEGKYAEDTHYFDIETINGVPHIHGVAMKECGK